MRHEVVQALPLTALIDQQSLHLGPHSDRRRFRPYNALDHVVAVSA